MVSLSYPLRFVRLTDFSLSTPGQSLALEMEGVMRVQIVKNSGEYKIGQIVTVSRKVGDFLIKEGIAIQQKMMGEDIRHG